MKLPEEALIISITLVNIEIEGIWMPESVLKKEITKAFEAGRSKFSFKEGTPLELNEYQYKNAEDYVK